ncbi:hypothetical protein [Methylobacterium haplocladii]|uniref:Uncharacterized protein n=2 Tax=Methylobacterium haplocladii TaxID=1176176 RepID=A0A512IL69_9HYPH|nr:hypothetical protein [Methylobacterium haplocladii]GEO98449.1 hypothetical protein MHA02_08370 [Methylobacterium haplocladii]
MVRSCLRGALVAAALLSAGVALGQEPEAAAPSPTADAPAKSKPRPKPNPKPKPAPKAETGTPELRTGADESPVPAASAPASPSQGTFAAPLVACDPDQAVQYDGPKGFSLWVTRAGSVTIDNPLRPLTPDVTRVLQLVIGDKLATAYGRDLTALRRGASPAALEGLLGGPIRWGAALGSLPDGFDIVSDAGTPLAQMRFKACGTAPAAKAPPAPVARKDGKARPLKKATADQTGSPPPASLGRPPASLGAASPGAPSPRPAVQQRQFNLPQGALSE